MNIENSIMPFLQNKVKVLCKLNTTATEEFNITIWANVSGMSILLGPTWNNIFDLSNWLVSKN